MPATNNGPRERLMDVRRARNVSRDALAAQAGIGYQTIVDIEQDKHVPGVDIAVRIAHVLGVSTDAIAWPQRGALLKQRRQGNTDGPAPTAKA